MIVLWIIFALFFVSYAIGFPALWLMLTAWSVGLSVYLLIKSKLPSPAYILISIAFAIIVALSYLGYALKFYMQIPISGISCFLSSLAVFSVMEKCGGYVLVKTDRKTSVFVSVLLGVVTGAILGLTNLLLSKSSMNVDFAVTFPRILLSLNPGIYEEIASRTIFMAFCTYRFAMQDKSPSRFQKFTMLFMMTVPHCLAHGFPLVGSLVLLVLFGFPFAFLQRKRDILSAIIAHTIVDLIRFVVFGLPVQ